jgi:hypothetical protein
MTPAERFLAEGAEPFGNRLLYRRQDVGVFNAGQLLLTPLGLAELARLEAITDVEVKPVKPRRVRDADVAAE